MNALDLMILKSNVIYLYDDCTLRQALEKMKRYGYAAVPVISRSGEYVGTVSDGDFLWALLLRGKENGIGDFTRSEIESLRLADAVNADKHRSCRIDAGLDELIVASLDQNFIPIVDDRNMLIGIVTRRAIIAEVYASNPSVCRPAEVVSDTVEHERIVYYLGT